MGVANSRRAAHAASPTSSKTHFANAGHQMTSDISDSLPAIVSIIRAIDQLGDQTVMTSLAVGGKPEQYASYEVVHRL
jgi:hypothetical protein